MTYTLSVLNGHRRAKPKDDATVKIFLRIPKGNESAALYKSKFDLENHFGVRISWSVYLLHCMKALTEKLEADPAGLTLESVE